MSGTRADRLNVLYIGVVRDGTGWAHAANDYILSLDAAGVNLVVRALKLNSVQAEVPQRVVELLGKKHARKYDAVIQHTLPHHMEFNGELGKNIGMYFTETSNFRSSSWPSYLNCMDEAWVCNAQSRDATLASGVTTPVRVFPIPTDISKYERSYKPLSLKTQLSGNFVFYWIGEFVQRKNLAALLRAFHAEFNPNEAVSLLIKTTPKGSETDFDAKMILEQFCGKIKEGMKLYRSVDSYKKEIVIAGRYSENEMMRLHTSCDCGVWPAFGEAWCIPAFEAMSLGKTPIVSNFGGFCDFMNNDCGWMIDGHMEPVWGTNLDTFPDLQTSLEDWFRVDIASLRHAMREAYEDDKARRVKALAGMDRAYDFTHAKVGEQMRQALLGD